jgi:hypothetical protein
MTIFCPDGQGRGHGLCCKIEQLPEKRLIIKALK